MREYSLLLSTIARLSSLAGEARIEFEHRIYDFGQVNQREKVNASFAFTYSGDVPLGILEVVPTRGGTTAKLDKKRYEPGEDGTTSVVFNSKWFPSKENQRITVKSKDRDCEKGTLLNASFSS